MARAQSAAAESAAGLPTLRVDGSIRDALMPDALAHLTTDDLARFLAGRRWFGAKGGTPRAIRIAGVIPLAWDDGSFAIARLEVETETGDLLRYQLPLAVRDRGAPQAVLASVESPEGDGMLFDAVEDAAFRRHLADAFARGARFEGAGSRWIVEPIGSQPLVVPLEAAIELGTAQQSNTSILLGQEGILKIFRRLESGENPDVEITTFLTTRASFPYTPALFGVSRFEDDTAAGRETTLSGMLAEYLPGSVDAWTYAVGQGEGRGRDRARAGEEGEERPPSPSFGADAHRLGEVTRALHDALASAGAEEPDFVPEPARPSDVEEWAAATERQVRDALDLLGRQVSEDRLPTRVGDDARAIVGRRDEFLGRVRATADSVRRDAGLRIRHHGDFHLGQVLRTVAGEFMIIDFEGEPARPLAERRRKHSALRDVAGMLRSFAYAGATIQQRGGGRADVWERDARAAFLAGYLDSGGDRSAFLPRAADHVEALVSLFEMEKVFYELAYELNNRPDWVWIPMRALR